MSERHTTLLALLRPDETRSRLDELCEFAPAEGEPEERVFWLIRLVKWLRPRGNESAAARLRFLRAQIAQKPAWRQRVGATLSSIVREADVARGLSYAGMAHHFHFGGALREWMLVRALPTACRTTDAAQILRLVFTADDAQWMAQPDAIALLRDLVDPALHEPLETALRTALVDLAHQIVAQAHAPAVKSLAHGDRSPFRGLYDAVAALDLAPEDPSAFEALRGRALQCARLVGSHRTELADRGADVNTTFQLARLRAQLERLRLLATLRHRHDEAALTDVLTALVREVGREARGARLVTRSIDLVVQNLVDTAASVGRNYLDDQHSAWRAAFLAGAGGGLLMAIATVVKCLLATLHLPPFYEGLAFSLNYASAFCAAYLLHFTIATKLPAHTAAALARAVQSNGGFGQRLRAFVTVWRSTARLQLAGLAGNVVVAAPLSFGIDRAWHRVLHHHVVTVEKAQHLLSSNSIAGPSILYAALTGLFLWISSLIGAWADNWTRTNHLADRLATNPAAMSRVGTVRARAYADAVVPRIGGLLGNLSLGFLLGGVPAAFAIASVPIEIRHITVSTGSVALALAAGVGTRSDIVLALLGLLAIAVVNVTVSFTLALWLALRATRGMRASTTSYALIRVGLRRWVSRDGRVRPRVEPALAPAVMDEARPTLV